MINGSEMFAWIMEQEDLWVAEMQCFHVSNLLERWLKENPNNKLDREFVARTIAFESRLAAMERIAKS